MNLIIIKAFCVLKGIIKNANAPYSMGENACK